MEIFLALALLERSISLAAKEIVLLFLFIMWNPLVAFPASVLYKNTLVTLLLVKTLKSLGYGKGLKMYLICASTAMRLTWLRGYVSLTKNATLKLVEKFREQWSVKERKTKLQIRWQIKRS